MAITFVAGTNPILLTTLVDQNGSALDLTGYTAKIWFQINSGTPVSGTATVYSATSGQVLYQFTTGQLTTGIMSYQINVYDSSLNLYATYPQAGSAITIVPSLGS